MPDLTEYEPFLTPQEAADFTGYALASIHNMVARGEIPFHRRKPSADARFLRSELTAWMRGAWPGAKASVR